MASKTDPNTLAEITIEDDDAVRELMRKISNKEITICEKCDSYFQYIRWRRLCDECKQARLQSSEYKARVREYNQRPEVKAMQREYYQRPEVRAKDRKRKQRPEVKAKERERKRSPEYRAKARERYHHNKQNKQ